MCMFCVYIYIYIYTHTHTCIVTDVFRDAQVFQYLDDPEVICNKHND